MMLVFINIDKKTSRSGIVCPLLIDLLLKHVDLLLKHVMFLGRSVDVLFQGLALENKSTASNASWKIR